MSTIRVGNIPEPEVRPGPRSVGTTIAAFGLGLAAAGPLLIVLGDPGAAPFVLPFVLVPAVAALVAWRFGTWAKIVAGAVAVLLLVSMVASPAGEGLRYPGSFLDFVPSVMFLIGGLLALVGAVAAVRGRRGTGSRLDGRERPLALATVAVIGVLAVVSAIVSVVSNRTVSEAAADGALLVAMEDGGFAEESISVPAVGASTLLLRNDGRVLHTFTSTELGVDETLLPGDEVLVEVTPPGAGVFQFWCRPHSEGADGDRDGMVGTIAAS